jgi:hypothetical protein
MVEIMSLECYEACGFEACALHNDQRDGIVHSGYNLLEYYSRNTIY